MQQIRVKHLLSNDYKKKHNVERGAHVGLLPGIVKSLLFKVLASNFESKLTISVKYGCNLQPSILFHLPHFVTVTVYVPRYIGTSSKKMPLSKLSDCCGVRG